MWTRTAIKDSRVLLPVVYQSENPLYHVMVRPSTNQIVIMIALDFITTDGRLTAIHRVDIPNNIKNGHVS
jgi:hypothetical protein